MAWVEANRSALGEEPMQRNGRHTLLRACNSILRRVSRSQHTVLAQPAGAESSPRGARRCLFAARRGCLWLSRSPGRDAFGFPDAQAGAADSHPVWCALLRGQCSVPWCGAQVLCGRVLMLLSVMFPLTERSGVNLIGALNTSHTTVPEPAEAVRTRSKPSLDPPSDSYEAQALAAAARPYHPAAAAARCAALAAVRAELGAPLLGAAQASANLAAGEEAGPLSVKFYSAFWGLQAVFQAPQSLLQGPEAAANWERYQASRLLAPVLRCRRLLCPFRPCALLSPARAPRPQWLRVQPTAAARSATSPFPSCRPSTP